MEESGGRASEECFRDCKFRVLEPERRIDSRLNSILVRGLARAQKGKVCKKGEEDK